RQRCGSSSKARAGAGAAGRRPRLARRREARAAPRGGTTRRPSSTIEAMTDTPPPPSPLLVCGIAGSLRQGSYNRALLRAAQELAPPGMEIRVFERLREVPPYDADLEAMGDPEPVRALKQAIAEADALLIATPEYNHGVPGVLKNAIDWASRPPRSSVLSGKPTAIFGASPGVTGTARAQAALRQSFVFTNTPAVLQ